jgi:tRNA A37 threonylcarbamoyladenosine modification protein TsaB
MAPSLHPTGQRYQWIGDLTAVDVPTVTQEHADKLLAAARGLALGLGIPAIGITRLEALAYGLPRPITVVEDARRGEVYVQAFGAEASEALLLDGSDLSHVLETSHLTGSAAGPAALPPAMPLAEAMARLAAARDLPQPRPAPFYLRGADAAPPSDPPPVILP